MVQKLVEPAKGAVRQIIFPNPGLLQAVAAQHRGIGSTEAHTLGAYCRCWHKGKMGKLEDKGKVGKLERHREQP